LEIINFFKFGTEEKFAKLECTKGEEADDPDFIKTPCWNIDEPESSGVHY
jgi:hypothetical protein